MDFQEYQKRALQTDQVPVTEDNNEIMYKVVPLLGLAGETGELLSEYKKQLRDGDAHLLFKDRVTEELGDLLWYIANVASKFELNLNEIAEVNLEKVQDRWNSRRSANRIKTHSFDSGYPSNERLPRKFEVIITEIKEGDSIKMKAFVNGQQVGDDLTDNAYAPDGYRFHDIFHFSYAAILGWSPVTRQNLKCKRKSDPKVDEVEDGGRAKAIEEGISALVFEYAEDHNFLAEVKQIDYKILKIIKSLTSRLEVTQCSVGEWEKAILMGYDVWRQVKENQGGTIVIDLDNQSITFQGTS